MDNRGWDGRAPTIENMDEDWLPPLPDPARPPRILSRELAFTLGYTASMIDYRLGTGQWRRVLPGVYLTSDTFLWRDHLDAALAFAGPGSVLSGAAALDGLRSVRRPDRVLVLVPRDRWARSTGFVTMRRTERLPARELQPGPACAALARAVADYAHDCRRIDDVRAVVAEVVRLGRCSIPELVAELEHGQRNGSAHLRIAVDEIGGGAWSAPEARAARLLRAAHVPAFKPNATIKLPNGKVLYVDFLWPRLRAVLEIDSDEFHGKPGDRDKTDERHILLSAHGYSVVHRRPYVVNRQPKQFVAGILAWLEGRAAELGVPVR